MKLMLLQLLYVWGCAAAPSDACNRTLKTMPVRTQSHVTVRQNDQCRGVFSIIARDLQLRHSSLEGLLNKACVCACLCMCVCLCLCACYLACLCGCVVDCVCGDELSESLHYRPTETSA